MAPPRPKSCVQASSLRAWVSVVAVPTMAGRWFYAGIAGPGVIPRPPRPPSPAGGAAPALCFACPRAYPMDLPAGSYGCACVVRACPAGFFGPWLLSIVSWRCQPAGRGGGKREKGDARPCDEDEKAPRVFWVFSQPAEPRRAVAIHKCARCFVLGIFNAFAGTKVLPPVYPCR